MKISSIIKDRNLYNKIFPYNHLDFQTINPINNKFIKKFDYDNENDIKDKIAASHNTFLTWKNTPIEERLSKMKNLINNLEKHKPSLASLITLEMVINKILNTIINILKLNF